MEITQESIELTVNEATILRAIADSEYCSLNYDDERLINYEVWMFSPSMNSGITGRSFSGVVSSLVKKGLVETNTDGDKHAMGVEIQDTWTIWMTQAGFDQLQKL